VGSLVARLHARIVVTPEGCWEWTGCTTEFGYGRIALGSRNEGYDRTHRVMWRLVAGDIPPGMCVLHQCDNPPCCNPAHLFLGTLLDNSLDMMSKHRGRAQLPRGEAHPSARLTDIDIARLRGLVPIVRNYAELGRRFGISKQHARDLALGAKR
jgi:hypothetical protein